MSLVLSKTKAPQIAVFDSVQAEDKYAHYIHHMFPYTMKVLDISGLYSLSKLREQLVKDKHNDKLNDWEVLKVKPIFGDEGYFAKEATSILRSDIIICNNEYESLLLKETLRMNVNIVNVLTFANTDDPTDKFDKERLQMWKDFDRRNHFVFYGNPNSQATIDALRYLCHHIWPNMKKELPDAQLHIYEINPSDILKEKKCEGIIYKGEMKDVIQLVKYKALLLPYRFGSGIREQIFDSFIHYLPVVTTPIGAEGIFLESIDSLSHNIFRELGQARFYSDMKLENLSAESRSKGESFQDKANQYYQYDPNNFPQMTFGGFYNNFTVDQFVSNAIKLSQDRKTWEDAIENCNQVAKQRMDKKINNHVLFNGLNSSLKILQDGRRLNLIQKQLWTETMKTNQKFVKFLNEKRTQQNHKQQIKLQR